MRETWGSQTQKKVGPQRSFAPYPQRSAVERAGALYFASCSQPRHVLLAGSVDEGRIPTDISLASHETPLGTDPGFGVEKGVCQGRVFDRAGLRASLHLTVLFIDCIAELTAIDA